MKIAILHQELEWSEINIHDMLVERGHRVTLADIRETDAVDLTSSELILNRVYASVANRNYRDNLKCLQVLQALEAKGILCINSYFTTRVDYSKYLSYKLLKAQGIPTPESTFVETTEDISLAKQFAYQHGFPLVIKRDMGGRAVDMYLLKDGQSLEVALDYFFDAAYRRQYDAGVIIQTYHRNIRDFDFRIAIVDKRFTYAFGRSLIANSVTEPAWIGSQSRGSVSRSYSPSEEELELAVRSTGVIQSIFNEVDMILSDAGPMVIENNPTPVFFQNKDEEKLISAMERILDSVID